MTNDITPSNTSTKDLASWMLLLDGILLALLGAIVIIGVDPNSVDTTLVRVFGIIMCVIGALLGARLWVMTRDRDLHPMLWLTSIVPVVLGIILLIWPLESQEALRAILAIILIIRGVLESSFALGRRTNPGWPFLLSHGIAAIVIGIMFWIPSIAQLAVVLLILFVGIDLIMQGARNVGVVRRLRKQAKQMS
ncbi:MAG: DUF308 domain-containing protein [Phycisphaerales bacterium]|nr:DUF308 domain-containing protein [Phycisphaerales bacterium]